MSELIVNGRPIPYETVPVSYMADSMRNYFEHGISPGSFGAALLAWPSSWGCRGWSWPLQFK